MGESTSDDKPSTNTVNQVRDQLWAAADLSTQAVDEGIQAASHAVKYGAVRGMEEMEKAKARSQVYSCSPRSCLRSKPGKQGHCLMVRDSSLQSFLDTGLAHYKDLEQRVFHTLKGEQCLMTVSQYLTCNIGPRPWWVAEVFCRIDKEKHVLSHADGVHIAREHDTASVAALTGAALLILPGKVDPHCSNLSHDHIKQALHVLAATFRSRETLQRWKHIVKS